MLFSETCCGLLWIAVSEFCLFLLCVSLVSVCRWCDLTVLVCRGLACECVQGCVSSLWICLIALQPILSIMQSAWHGAVEGRAHALLYLSQLPWQQRGAAAHSSVSARLQSLELVRDTKVSPCSTLIVVLYPALVCSQSKWCLSAAKDSTIYTDLCIDVPLICRLFIPFQHNKAVHAHLLMTTHRRVAFQH